MSHGRTQTSAMSFTNTSRNSKTLSSTISNNQSAGTTLDVAFTSGSTPWSSDNIWGNGNFANGLTSNGFSREQHGPRGGVTLGSRNITDSKAGSGSLTDSSTPDGWTYKANWGGKRSLPTTGTALQQCNTDHTGAQRSVSNAGIPQSLSSSTQNSSSYGSRPSTINLNSTSTAGFRPSYSNAYSGGFAGTGNERPPNVYTKFDRPSDPSSRTLPDSARGSLWSDTSPTDELKAHFPMPAGSRTGSMPGSRNGSLPPSRHSDGQPHFTSPDYSRLSQRPHQIGSGVPSISPQGDSGMSFNGNGQLALQFSQLSMNGGDRTGNSHRPPGGANAIHKQASAWPRAQSTSLSSANSAGPGAGLEDPLEQLDRNGLAYIGNHSPMMPHQNSSFSTLYNTSPFANRFLQPATSSDFRPGQTYTGHPASNRAYDSIMTSETNWRDQQRGLMNTDTPTSPTLQDPSLFVDPQLRHMMATQMRNQFMFNPYAVPLTPTSPYAMLPMTLPGIGAPMVDPDMPAGDGLRSALLEDFKTAAKSKRFDLKDIYDHIAEFSGDQHGSRFIQTKLETANSDEKERVFREIEPNALPLMTDVFGNYVIQKFFEHGDQKHKKILANKMRGRVLELSLQMYGCRVVQKALDHVLVDQQKILISELETHVIKCVKDQNGNHVIQKAIERCPSGTIDFIFAAFRGQVEHLSTHAYGCRVIQRCLERCEPDSKAAIMSELMKGIQSMIADQYGNYVVQHVVDHDDGEARMLVLSIVGRGLEQYSKHKFASNVVEKCIEKADDAWRRQVVFNLATGDPRRCEGEGVLVTMIKDNFGNYVIQKLLDTLSPEDYANFTELLQPAVSQAKRTGCGKQVLSIEKKMHRFSTSYRNLPLSSGQFNAAAYQLPLPPSNYASNYGSAATTPPQLTPDIQSMHSSGLPSVNGDAIGGAAMSSRKGSDQSHEPHYLR